MPDNTTGRTLFYQVEADQLRQEAMRLFEACLTNADESALIAFLEVQIAHEPPRLTLLNDIADDLQQRLMSLREYHFDVRERVVQTLADSYHVDITPLTPPDRLDHYHLVTVESVLSYTRRSDITMNESEKAILRKMIEASLHMASQLHNDIVMTSHFFEFVTDWIEGMSASVARAYWTSHYPVRPSETAQAQNLPH